MSLLDKASLIVTPNAYKTSKLYSVVPNTTLGDMDVVRATTATRVNASGLIESVGLNIPRIDYTNGSCPSILVEPQRTNLALRSEELNDASWTKFGSLTISANSTTSPSGVSNADKVIPNAGTGTFAISQSFTKASSNITYTLSGYAKESGYNFLLFRIDSGAANGIKGSFNILNTTISTAFSVEGIGFTFINANIKNANNGWVKWSVTFTSDLLPLLRPIIYVSNIDGNPFAAPSYTANGTSGAFIWGAQLEVGSYPTSYVPTVATTVTRNADVISKTGISSLIGQTEGTVFIDFYNQLINSTILFLNKNLTNSILINTSPTFIQCFLVCNGIQFSLLASSYLIKNEKLKVAIKYSSAGAKIFVNGILKATNVNPIVFTASIADVNLNDGSVVNSNQTIYNNGVQLYKTALTDTECITLTTL